MMKAIPAFVLYLPYQTTLYKPLSDLAISYRWIGSIGQWIFPYSDLSKVEALVGTVKIEGVREVFDVTPIELPQWKGRDIVMIVTYPEIYEIIEHQKKEDGTVQQITTRVSRTTVSRIYDEIVARMPLSKPIKSRTVAEKVCVMFGIDRFHRESGSFDFAKFFGNRKDYKQLFYYPIKVLQHQGYIAHSKSGYVTRLK